MASTVARESQHLFGPCPLCAEEMDQYVSPLVLVQCNKRDCTDLIFHSDCIIDCIDRRAGSRRSFYLKKSSFFDLSGFPCPRSLMDPRNVMEGPHSASCTGKIALSSQMHQLKRPKKQPVAQQPIVKDAARKKVTAAKPQIQRPHRPPVAPSAAVDATAETPKSSAPVGAEFVDDEGRIRKKAHQAAAQPPISPSSASSTPWWAARAMPSAPPPSPQHALAPVESSPAEMGDTPPESLEAAIGMGYGNAQATAEEAKFEARLVSHLSHGRWELLSILGDPFRGCGACAGVSLKVFIASREDKFELLFDTNQGAWRARLKKAERPPSRSLPPPSPPTPPPLQMRHETGTSWQETACVDDVRESQPAYAPSPAMFDFSGYGGGAEGSAYPLAPNPWRGGQQRQPKLHVGGFGSGSGSCSGGGSGSGSGEYSLFSDHPLAAIGQYLNGATKPAYQRDGLFGAASCQDGLAPPSLSRSLFARAIVAASTSGGGQGYMPQQVGGDANTRRRPLFSSASGHSVGDSGIIANSAPHETPWWLQPQEIRGGGGAPKPAPMSFLASAAEPNNNGAFMGNSQSGRICSYTRPTPRLVTSDNAASQWYNDNDANPHLDELLAAQMRELGA